ncbi:MAG: hypothetical protein J2P28_16430, partial [Actinobacteria bacterium]|nr:hypothetical protein [Actinomycetota bacterium]
LDPKHRDDVIQPLDALVILKGLDSSGRVAYWITSTEGLSNMEVLGMTTWAAEVAIQDDDGD